MGFCWHIEGVSCPNCRSNGPNRHPDYMFNLPDPLIAANERLRGEVERLTADVLSLKQESGNNFVLANKRTEERDTARADAEKWKDTACNARGELAKSQATIEAMAEASMATTFKHHEQIEKLRADLAAAALVVEEYMAKVSP